MGLQETQRFARHIDPIIGRGAFVAPQVVHDDNVAGPQFGYQNPSGVGPHRNSGKMILPYDRDQAPKGRTFSSFANLTASIFSQSPD